MSPSEATWKILTTARRAPHENVVPRASQRHSGRRPSAISMTLLHPPSETPRPRGRSINRTVPRSGPSVSVQEVPTRTPKAERKQSTQHSFVPPSLVRSFVPRDVHPRIFARPCLAERSRIYISTEPHHPQPAAQRLHDSRKKHAPRFSDQPRPPIIIRPPTAVRPQDDLAASPARDSGPI